MNGMKNTSYIFIPFTFARQADFDSLVGALDESRFWEQVHDDIMYMLKYVADKINSRDKKNCQCFHYRLKDESRNVFGLGAERDWFTTDEHSFHGCSEGVCFQVLSVHLYCFSTTVCMIAFQVHFEKDNPLWIANAQYYLKKVSREKIKLDRADARYTTMLSLAKDLVCEFTGISEFCFFYHANPSTERANILSYLEVGLQADYKEELFYLRRCYGEGFLYLEDEKADKEEIYMPSKDIVWGISPEAAVCLACPNLGREAFIKNTFYKNFNAQYLFMYVLLLHQKYVLYMFLTKIGVGIYNSLETLEEYRHQLYEFETDFVFSRVTEVPQYQNLYDKMAEAFALKRMYEDVHEPLMSLGEIRRETSEKEQKRRDESVNKALLMLSVLSFFSALADGYGFVELFFGKILNDTGIWIAQIICVGSIILSFVFVLKNLIDSRKN